MGFNGGEREQAIACFKSQKVVNVGWQQEWLKFALMEMSGRHWNAGMILTCSQMQHHCRTECRLCPNESKLKFIQVFKRITTHAKHFHVSGCLMCIFFFFLFIIFPLLRSLPPPPRHLSRPVAWEDITTDVAGNLLWCMRVKPAVCACVCVCVPSPLVWNICSE